MPSALLQLKMLSARSDASGATPWTMAATCVPWSALLEMVVGSFWASSSGALGQRLKFCQTAIAQPAVSSAQAALGQVPKTLFW